MHIDVDLPGNQKVRGKFRGFEILTDQPTDSGGDNEGASPFELFLASLATCAGYYVVAFCNSRNIPADKITLSCDFPRNPESKLVEEAKIVINLPEDFPEKYRDAVVRSAEKCTVKKHLEHPPTITVEAKPS